MIFLTALTLRETRTWAAEANQLSELEQDLEQKVAQRSAELTASLDKLNEHHRLASRGLLQLRLDIRSTIRWPMWYAI